MPSTTINNQERKIQKASERRARDKEAPIIWGIGAEESEVDRCVMRGAASFDKKPSCRFVVTRMRIDARLVGGVW